MADDRAYARALARELEAPLATVLAALCRLSDGGEIGPEAARITRQALKAGYVVAARLREEKAAPDGAPSPAPESASKPPKADGHPHRVLIVDDHPACREMLRAIVAGLGHEPICVNHGEAALVSLARERFDLVLMDIQMPVMDGRTALRKIRERKATAGLPVIAVTASVSETDAPALINEGFDAFLAKPVDVREMARLITLIFTDRLHAA